MPMNLPLEIQKIVENLESVNDKEEYLKRVYAILIDKYHGSRLKFITRLWELFDSNIDGLWRKNGFIYCTQTNRLLKVILVASKFFNKEDIRFRWTLTWYIVPHQYAVVKINDNKYINVDIWANIFGIEFGDFAHGFHQSSK
ncbi:MAG: hypothetical protein PHV78_03020 [Patescibacteria group bacterium]|nr:hypothetical protein [Patescibacteria group bacterium]MDD5121643.1 hypothetical protein [Patescibacteria group bacterium]MDD5221903.1 hypothetical protein [Patescibacteria group bacterium]MDD5396193.1 hypothetical protein [Patescibacteria group bacterium]